MLTTQPPPVPRRSATRAGFTLVELLVACALTVLVMAILATAFQKGMETLSHLKSAVTLSEQLRSAEAIMRRDLAARHLETRSGGPVRVSDKQLAAAPWASPDRGFFRVKHGSAPFAPTAAGTADSSAGYVQENTDEGVASFRAWDHELAMTVKLPGGSASEVFVADMGALPAPPPNTTPTLGSQSQPDYVTTANQFAGQWGEVAYFLVPSAPSTTGEDGGAALQLFTLRRRFRALAPTGTVQVPSTTATATARNFPELSISPRLQPPSPPNQFTTVNTPADVALIVGQPVGVNRLGDFRDVTVLHATPNTAPSDARANPFTALVKAIPQSDPLGGSDILLANVVSFQVTALTTADPTGFPARLTNATDVNGGQATYLNSGTPVGAALDTAFDRSTSNPKPVVRAVKLNLRVYDVRNRMTRQMTIVQDL